MRIGRGRQFWATFAAFVVLGGAFKVMVLIEGLTEVRPVNAVPPVAGLAFGAVGALACGLGNLAADLFGTFSAASALGFAANFVAAYLPYRLWHLFSGEAPNLHRGKNILLFLLASFTAALTVAWMLGFGIEALLGDWIEGMYLYVFWNNFGFSAALGMPVLIILTSDSVGLEPVPPPKTRLPGRLARLQKPLYAAFLLLMLLFFLCVCLGAGPAQVRQLRPLSLLAAAGLVFLLL